MSVRSSTARHPGPGSCCNCLLMLPRTAAGSTKFVKFMRSDTSQVKYLRIGNALSYVFRGNEDQAPEIDLSFCTKCHALFAVLLQAYTGFRAESHPDSVVVDFLEGVKVKVEEPDTWPGPGPSQDSQNHYEPTTLFPVLVKIENLLSEVSAEDEGTSQADELGNIETDPLNTDEISIGRILKKRKSAIKAKRFLKSYNADEDDGDTNSEEDYDPQESFSSDEVDVEENNDGYEPDASPIRVPNANPILSCASKTKTPGLPVSGNPNEERNSVFEKRFVIKVQPLPSVEVAEVEPTSNDYGAGNPENDPLKLKTEAEATFTGLVTGKRKSATEAKRLLKRYIADEYDMEGTRDEDYDPQHNLSSDGVDLRECEAEYNTHVSPALATTVKRRKHDPSSSSASNSKTIAMPASANPNAADRKYVFEKTLVVNVQRLSSKQGVATIEPTATGQAEERKDTETTPLAREEMPAGRVLRKRKSATEVKLWLSDEDEESEGTGEDNSDEDYSESEVTSGEDMGIRKSMSSATTHVEESEEEVNAKISPTQVITRLRTKISPNTANELNKTFTPANPNDLQNWVLEETYASEAAALAQIALEGTWSRLHYYADDSSKKIVKSYYRCNQVQTKNLKDWCAKSLYLHYHYRGDSTEVSLYRCGATHTNHSEDTLRVVKSQVVLSAAEVEAELYTDEHGVVLLRCFQCPETFGGVKDWAQHQLSIHSIRVGWGAKAPASDSAIKKLPPLKGRYLPCPAPDCCKLFFAPRIRGHVQMVHKKNPCFKCSKCGNGFSSDNGLRTHLKTKHSSDTCVRESYRCRHCGYTFTMKASLQRHEKIHLGELLERRHKCSQCGKAFERKKDLENHIWTHLPPDQQPKPFKCTICPAAFGFKHSLDRHQLVHSEKRDQFKCTSCDKAYPRKRPLLNHYMSVHQISEVVARAFLNMKPPILVLNEDIPVSLREFTKKPELACEICFEKYTRLEYLTAHLMGIHGKTEEEAKVMAGLDTRTRRSEIVSKSFRKARKEKDEGESNSVTE